MMAATAQSLAYNLIFHPKSELHLLDEETILFLALRSERSLIYSLCSMNVSESHETCRGHVRVTFKQSKAYFHIHFYAKYNFDFLILFHGCFCEIHLYLFIYLFMTKAQFILWGK